MELAKVFDTYCDSEAFERFIDTNIPDGHIVAAACKDDCASKLSERGKHWFASMGSIDVWHLVSNDGFAFVGVKGSKEANEKRAPDVEGVSMPVSVTSIYQFKNESKPKM